MLSNTNSSDGGWIDDFLDDWRQLGADPSSTQGYGLFQPIDNATTSTAVPSACNYRGVTRLGLYIALVTSLIVNHY
jgi:hypothetical protein